MHALTGCMRCFICIKEKPTRQDRVGCEIVE